MPNIIETTDAAAGTSTTYSLSTGQTAQGTLGAAGDHDWYSVNLVAGQTYTFAMTGTGVNNVQDTYLRLYAPGGSTLVAQDDNNLGWSANSIFSYTASASGTYYIDAASNNSGTGQYGVSFTVGTRASFDVQMGGGVMDVDLSWSAPGTGATLTVGFMQNADGRYPNFSQFTAQQMAATMAVLQQYSEVCGLSFNVINPSGYTNNATILLSNYNNPDGAGAWGYYPGSTVANAADGNVYVNLAYGASSTSLPFGTYEFQTLLHEMGHAVGLAHPGKYNAAPNVSPTYSANAQFVQDTLQYSVMSYFNETNTTGGSDFGYPDTLMLFDIYQVQQIYGANNSTRATDTTYGFNTNVGSIYNFAINTNPALCIWDGGGTDTLDCSGFSQSQVINLNSGTFSNIGGLSGNVSIALGAVIENAVGGSGVDDIYLSSQATNNLINGSGGIDTVHITYTYGTGYTVSGTASNLVMTGAAGTDTFQNVEYVVFINGTQVSTIDLAATVPVSNFITISDVTILEGDSGTKVATFNVTRTGGTAAFAVNYATANGTALAGSDYVAISGTLNFAAGVNTQTISVTVNGDTAVESNETFFVNLSGATNGTTITDSQGQGTITDNDTAPVAGAIAISDLTISEGNSGTQVAIFNVTRTGGTAAFAVNYATANGTATAGSDYVATTGTLNFAAGVNTQTVSVTINGDTAIEPNETFFVNLSGPTNGATISDSQGQGTIIDNDVAGDDFADSFTDTTAPFGLVSVGGSATGNLEGAGDHDWFRVTLTAGVSVTIDLQGVDTGAGTLSDPYLYLYDSSGQLLAQNDDAGTGLNSQLDYAPSVTGTYYIDAAAYGNFGAGTYRVNVTAAPTNAGSITISDLTITEGNSGTQVATFTVARTGGTGAFAVNYATANGTAVAGSDYAAKSGTLTFGTGVNTQTISVTINGDTVVEPNETFFVNLSGATNGATIADSQGQGTIIDNDTAGDDFADSFTDFTAPFGLVIVNSVSTGNLEVKGDRDWFRVQLTAGTSYTINLQGQQAGGGTLEDPYLRLHGSNGALLAETDDIVLGINRDSQLAFTAATTGTYYLEAGAFDDNYTGTYKFSVSGAIPTTITLKPGSEGQDLWITNTFTYSDDYGVDNAQLKVGGWGDVYDTIIRFDLSGVNASHVSSATMRLYNLADLGGTPTGMSIEELLSSWDESYGWYSYGTRPGSGGSITGDPPNLSFQHLSTVGAPNAGWISIDITAAVNDWLSNPASNNGLLIRPLSTNNNFNDFVSSDATGANAPFRPELVIQIGTATPPHTSDFNGDHFDDALFQNVTTGEIYYANMANGQFSGWGLAANTPGWNVVGHGDIKHDGYADVVIQSQGGQIYYANIANGTFSDWGTVSNTPGYQVKAVADVNGDSSADVVIQSQSGQIYYANMANGNFLGWGTVSNTPGWNVTGAGDINHDGCADVVIQSQSGQIYYANMANGAFSGWGAVSNTPGYQVKAVADVNGDNFADVVVQNGSTGKTYYANMANGNFSGWGDVANTPGWQVKDAIDINNDGFADVLFQYSDGTAYAAQMGATGLDHWVQVTGSIGADWHLI